MYFTLIKRGDSMKTRLLVTSGLMAALVTIGTIIVRIPTPLKGYVNLGDCVVLLCALMLPLKYSFFAAGIGSAMADIFSGYIIYAPATFLIKGLMTVIVCCILKSKYLTSNKLLSLIISGAFSELFMVLGYYFYEGVLYGFIPSAVNIPINLLQGIVGVITFSILAKICKKINLFN